MRHKKSGRQLNRSNTHLNAMLKNMTCSLLKYETIKTTLAKAKELRRIVEPIITRSKKDNVSNRRLVFSKIRSNTIVAKLFNTFGPIFLKRPGGYTRILKCGFRSGDQAPMAYIELVDRVKNTQIDAHKKR